jgi:hypothetical protein
LLGELGISIPSLSTGSHPPKNLAIADDERDTLKLLESESMAARSQLKKVSATAGAFEVEHYPVGTTRTWNQAELASGAQKAVCRNTGWPIGVVMTKPEFAPIPTAWGIRARIESGELFDYWALEKHAAFYFLRRLDEDTDRDLDRRKEKRWVYFDTRIWRVAETLLHCSNLYRALDMPPETPIFVRITHAGLNGRTLGVADRMRMMHWERSTSEDEARWSQTVPLGSIEAALEDLTREATSQLFMLFDFWQAPEEAFMSVFGQFLKSRV